jgi:hypothetical protein
MSCPDVGWLDLKVNRFTTQLIGDMRSSQTKTALHHYPIKGAHQLLVMECIFSNWDEYRSVQEYVRRHQIRALRTVQQPEVVLYWPERGIENWSGVIKTIAAGDERFNVAPTSSLEIQLIDSMISQKTWTSSFGEDFGKFFESAMNLEDPWIVPPPASNQPGAGTGTDGGGSFFDDYLGGLLGY